MQAGDPVIVYKKSEKFYFHRGGPKGPHIVVGDIIQVFPGVNIPGDCVLIGIPRGCRLVVNEKGVGGEAGVVKGVLEDGMGDPFLVIGSKVVSGVGKAVVCGLGGNCCWRGQRASYEIVENEVGEDLYGQAQWLGVAVRELAKWAIWVIFLVSVGFSLKFAYDGKFGWLSAELG